MKSVSNELEISIKKVDNDDYKIFYKGILLDELVVIPLNDFHFNIKLNEGAHEARRPSHSHQAGCFVGVCALAQAKTK